MITCRKPIPKKLEEIERRHCYMPIQKAEMVHSRDLCASITDRMKRFVAH